jgi:hypothetical protein
MIVEWIAAKLPQRLLREALLTAIGTLIKRPAAECLSFAA